MQSSSIVQHCKSSSTMPHLHPLQSLSCQEHADTAGTVVYNQLCLTKQFLQIHSVQSIKQGTLAILQCNMKFTQSLKLFARLSEQRNSAFDPPISFSNLLNFCFIVALLSKLGSKRAMSSSVTVIFIMVCYSHLSSLACLHDLALTVRSNGQS
jgi:hypothetical protein